MNTHTFPAASADQGALDTLAATAQNLPAGAAREAIEALAATLRAGNDAIIAGAEEFMTPSQAAKILGVSRTHLYKALDRGALPFSVVGARDRRIAMSDLVEYMNKAEDLRRQTAYDAAHTHTTKAQAIDEM